MRRRDFLQTTAALALAPAVLKADHASTLEKAVSYIRKTQNPDGSWGAARPTGVTGIVVTGLLKNGVGPDDPTVAKGLGFIEDLINPKAGHIAGKGDVAVQLHNYVTSVNVMALQAAGKPDKYRNVVGDAVRFLKQLQWDDGEQKKQSDDFFGGAGYDSKSRPDLSNTQFFMDALKDAGVKADDPAFRNALVFISRCQNLRSEYNDRPWAGKINDGSFIYSAAGGGSTKTSDAPDAPLTGYGSMTYAGVKSMIYCGVSKEDVRFKAAFEWLKKNYTVDANPGMPKDLAERGLYYYYHTMAKSLTVMNVDEIAGHDWRKDLVAALEKRQQSDGSWVNKTDRWMEGDPQLVTGYALLTLSYCKPKK